MNFEEVQNSQRRLARRLTAQNLASHLRVEPEPGTDPLAEKWNLNEIDDTAYLAQNDEHRPRRIFAVLCDHAAVRNDDKIPDENEWGLFAATLNGTQEIEDLIAQLNPNLLSPLTQTATA